MQSRRARVFIPGLEVNVNVARSTYDHRLGPGTRIVRIGAWLLKAKFTHGSIVIVLDEKHRILLVKEGIRERGRWGLPGGFTNLRESARQTATRELREEAGVHVDAGNLRDIAEYKQPWAWHYDHLFVVEVTADEMGHHRRSGEIQDSQWHDQSKLPPLTRATAYALDRWTKH
jgi:ADP-ribose pyrophosphatase YjhB (NUDIX family)